MTNAVRISRERGHGTRPETLAWLARSYTYVAISGLNGFLLRHIGESKGIQTNRDFARKNRHGIEGARRIERDLVRGGSGMGDK